MSLINQNSVGIVRHGDSSEDIDAQFSKVEKQWRRGVQIRNFDCETLTSDTGGEQ